jgi:hypothetical protein
MVALREFPEEGPLSRLRFLHALCVLPAVVVAAVAAGAAGAADAGQTLTGEAIQASFQPCPTAPGPNGFQICATTGVEPPHVQADCHPGGTSTLTLDDTGFAFGPIDGIAEIHVRVTIGPQDQPPVPDFAPFPWSGVQAGTIGLAAGPLTSFDEQFRITSYDGQTTVNGTKHLVADLGNTGVCQEYAHEQPPDDPVFGLPLTAYFSIANAQVLAYDATIQSPLGTSHDSGVSEAYLENSFGRFDADPTSVATSTGNFLESFGTSHPLGPPPDVKPGKHCGDRNHVGAKESDCKRPPK